MRTPVKTEELRVKNLHTAHRRRWLVAALFTLHFSLVLSACGFHLRGGALSHFPSEFSTLRIEMPGRMVGSRDPLRLVVEAALREQARVTLVTAGQVPVLVLEPEQFSTGAVSVTAAGRASEYQITLMVGFRLRTATGQDLLPPQTIRLQREYVYDPVNVVAKEREEQDLKEVMRRDVAAQIVRRLARAPTSPPVQKKPVEPPATVSP